MNYLTSVAKFLFFRNMSFDEKFVAIMAKELRAGIEGVARVVLKMNCVGIDSFVGHCGLVADFVVCEGGWLKIIHHLPISYALVLKLLREEAHVVDE